MEIYGADLNGINGQLIRFEAVKEEGKRGKTLLGLAQKVVREGCIRAEKGIETLNGDWTGILKNSGYTIALYPPDTPRSSSGLDLPIAIMFLQASILQNIDSLEEEIEKIKKKYESIGETEKERDEKRKRILETLKAKIDERKNALKYHQRLASNKNRYLLIGTLSITSGKIETPQFGMMGMLAAVKKGFTIIVPEDTEIHAALVAQSKPNCIAYKAHNLQEVWNIVLGIVKPRKARYVKSQIRKKEIVDYVPDMKAIEGCSKAKYAITVALAGGHNVLFVGPQGHGKTMTAMAGIKLMPNLDQNELWEVNKIYSAKGNLAGNELFLTRPFQQAHNNTPPAALLGGGVIPRPGLVSLAHKGILFFDEINLATKSLIESLREPINNKKYSVIRQRGTIEYPCNFIFVAAMNPCNCGWYLHFECLFCQKIFFGQKSYCLDHQRTKLSSKCKCTQRSIDINIKKLSGPLLDRIDMKVLVSRYDITNTDEFDYATVTVKRKIQNTRNIQEIRYRKTPFNCNADVPDLSQIAESDKLAIQYLKEFRKGLNITTPRKETKLVLVARTIADLDESKNIKRKHFEKAVEVMGLTHEYFKDFA